MIDTTAIPFPTDATLKKYGLSRLDWAEIFTRQHNQCGICHKEFKPGQRINVDHEHIKGWKHMQPEQRKQHVRGLLCYTCNKFMVMRGITSEKLFNGWQYMRSWEVRLTPENLRPLDPGQKSVKRRNIRHTNQQ